MSDYLCNDGKPYQHSTDVIAAGLDHDDVEYWPADWRLQTDEDRMQL